MDRSLARLLDLLAGEDLELARAAALVLAGLQPKDPEALPALGRALEAEDRRLRTNALRAIGAIGNPDCFDEVSPLLDEPGDLGRRAVDVIAAMGPKVLTKLKRRFSQVGETGRRRILDVAARVRGAAGLDIILTALESGNADEVIELGDRLGAEYRSATARERSALAKRVEAFVQSPAGKKNPQAVGAAVDLLGRILGSDAAAHLAAFTASPHHPVVRRRALEALGRVAPHSNFEPEFLARLLGYLRDRDFTNVAAPAMSLLERASLDASHATQLLACLHGNDPALRRFAVTALGQVDTPKSASALLEVLRGDNPDLRKRAALSLSRQKSAAPLVAAALAAAEDAPNAWVLARILHPQAHASKPDQVTALARACAAWLEVGDPRAEALVFLLRDRHMDRVLEEGLKRIKRLKKHRKAAEIVNLLRPLLRDGVDLPVELRYELALAELMRGPKDVVREVRLANLGLQGLEPLLHLPDFALAGRLKREKSVLTPEEYYLIGSHFAERPYADRIFGGELLRWLVKTFPEDSASQSAANKLLMEGFAPPPPPRRRPPAAKKRKKVRPPAPPAKKVPAKKPPAPKKAPSKKTPPKKAAAKKAPPKKVAPKKAPAKKAAPKRAPAKKATTSAKKKRK